MLQSLDEPSTIVMDNASYHSRIANKRPTMSHKKTDILDYLKRHDIPFSDSDTKTTLLQHIDDNPTVRNITFTLLNPHIKNFA